MAPSDSRALWMKHVKAIEKIFGIKFKREYTLAEAITRRSWKSDHKDIDRDDNERLEFLGDGVLRLLLNEYLYKHPEYSEGDMTIMRAKIENNVTLANIGRKLGIQSHILIGGSEKDKIVKEKVIADTLEAIMGAIYLDQGLERTREVFQDKILLTLLQILLIKD